MSPKPPKSTIMRDSNLRFFVAISASNPRLCEEVDIWISQRKIEIFRTGLFENIIRKTSGSQNHSCLYGFVLKDEQALLEFKTRHFGRLITDFQKRFPKNKVDIIPVLGEIEIQ